MALFPPVNFGVVEDRVYRCGIPDRMNHEFLRGLKLKTTIVLSPNTVDESFTHFLETEGIDCFYAGRSNNEVLLGMHPLTEEMITESLRILSNLESYPILIVCKSGRGLTGVLIACLRKLQRWSLISIFEEFRRFTGGSRLQPQHEQFIELYDTELISITTKSPSFLQR